MDIPHGGASAIQSLPLSPLAKACSRKDLTAIHEILEKTGYKDDEGTANEVHIFFLGVHNIVCWGRAYFLICVCHTFIQYC
jgi:hypothetical protein